MALRTTTYTALTLEGIASRADFAPGDALPEMVLRRQIAHRFGEETAERLAKQLAELSGSDGIEKVTDALLECDTGDEFIERVRTA